MKRFLFVAGVIFVVLLSLTSNWSKGQSRSDNATGQRTDARVQSLRITVLSTMLADQGIGEWGYAALVEVDGRRILFDTGARPDTVLSNVRELKIDLASVQDVILSHNHGDHTGGLMTLRREFAKASPAALSRTHVGAGIFWSRPMQTSEGNPMVKLKPAYEATGGVFVEYHEPKELYPGVWLTGPVARVHPERNWSGTGRVRTPDAVVEDTIPEDMSLVFNTDKGLVVLSGCGHAGIINTLEYAQKKIRNAPVYAAIGGFHLFALPDDKLTWTAAKLREFGLKQFLGGHCTGIEPVYRFRQEVGLDRKSCLVSAVGSSFSLETGINPLMVAR
jgi:7,8-dihydropterin-6-yl-methyl-4-(beta-D-ribofuranosyl)aminobenzene 5'-phosphate synthase